MRIDELLDLIDETLEESAGVPFTGGKRMVDVDRVRDLLDDVRINMPEEIKRAKDIVADRAAIIAEANSESSRIIKRAQEHVKKLISQQEIVKNAEVYAKEIKTKAQEDAKVTSTKMANYCDNLLKNTQEQMIKSSAEIKTIREVLKKSKP